MSDFLAGLDALFQTLIVKNIEAVIFFDLAFWDDGRPDELELPAVVCWLGIAALFFTLRFRFVNVRGFRHGTEVVRGLYTRAGDQGEISPFQALSAALSATVGLGNIAGVATAVGLGGPGAVFWMVLAGALGMSSKFAEVTLAQMYRVTRVDGHVSGGGMHYLRAGLRDLGWPRLGAALAAVFAVMCIGASFGGGNMYQANQSFAQFANVVPAFANTGGAVAFGAFLSVLVGLVIIGGIKRIGEVASRLVPAMCGIYLIAGFAILALHAPELPAAFATIVRGAFSPDAAFGGFVGVLITGFRRAGFSNEAGCGSAAIAHSAATTSEPVRQGMVALLEPFIDTVIVCHMTGLVVVVTGAYTDPEAGSGIAMTSWAFASVFPGFQYVLSLTAFLFAYSTMISWSYYGEQCWVHLFGLRSLLAYKVIFLLFTWAGAVFAAQAVLDFGDLMILGMAFPNLVGVVLLSGKINAALEDYFTRLRAGRFQRVR
ncbi:MAG TPA: alanine/glycine:cation symporter family protein [Myxococcota bacterium]|nr:alanine/glycine:cation symporter family protein [Myxococcota bacterium]